MPPENENPTRGELMRAIVDQMTKGLANMNSLMSEITEREFNDDQTRPQSVPYCDPLDAEEVLETALDADVVCYMQPPPSDALQDQLDLEEHVARCEQCAEFYKAEVCAHCLETRLCDAVTIVTTDSTAYAIAYYPIEQRLCRSCRTNARGGALDLWTTRA